MSSNVNKLHLLEGPYDEEREEKENEDDAHAAIVALHLGFALDVPVLPDNIGWICGNAELWNLVEDGLLWQVERNAETFALALLCVLQSCFFAEGLLENDEGANRVQKLPTIRRILQKLLDLVLDLSVLGPSFFLDVVASLSKELDHLMVVISEGYLCNLDRPLLDIRVEQLLDVACFQVVLIDFYDIWLAKDVGKYRLVLNSMVLICYRRRIWVRVH